MERMSNEDALEILQYDADRIKNPTYAYKKEALEVAIEAIKELERYKNSDNWESVSVTNKRSGKLEQYCLCPICKTSFAKSQDEGDKE